MVEAERKEAGFGSEESKNKIYSGYRREPQLTRLVKPKKGGSHTIQRVEMLSDVVIRPNVHQSIPVMAGPAAVKSGLLRSLPPPVHSKRNSLSEAITGGSLMDLRVMQRSVSYVKLTVAWSLSVLIEQPPP